MKTMKSGFLSGMVFLVALTPFLFTSCEEESIDLRDEIVGQYSYTVKMYDLIDGELVYLGDQGDLYDIEGTMRVLKNTDPDVLDFWDGNVLMFHGVDIQDSGNAIVFDIPEQEAWVGPVNVQIAGYDYWEVGNSYRHGAFLYEDSSVEIGFSARIMDVDSGLVMVLLAFRD
jgi:hypothetical protein